MLTIIKKTHSIQGNLFLKHFYKKQKKNKSYIYIMMMIDIYCTNNLN